MPFGLKNVGAIYQRYMVSMFHDMVHDTIEVYVDDILTKNIQVKIKTLQVCILCVF